MECKFHYLNPRKQLGHGKKSRTRLCMAMHYILKDSVCSYRVKSGNFGHHVNSDIHLQTVSSGVSLFG